MLVRWSALPMMEIAPFSMYVILRDSKNDVGQDKE